MGYVWLLAIQVNLIIIVVVVYTKGLVLGREFCKKLYLVGVSFKISAELLKYSDQTFSVKSGLLK